MPFGYQTEKHDTKLAVERRVARERAFAICVPMRLALHVHSFTDSHTLSVEGLKAPKAM